MPLRFDVVTNGKTESPESLVVAYPRVPLEPATDYAVVVTDSIHYTDGTPLSADRLGRVALGLTSPATTAEAALYAYDAPARAAMKAAGLDPAHAVRVWDFTTRSLTEPTEDVDTLRAAELAAFEARFPGDAGAPVDGGIATDSGVGIALDSLTADAGGTVAVAVIGRITGVPNFLNDAGSLSRDEAGSPTAVGVHDVPFRVAIPVGAGDYNVVMYGHGTGGTYDEDTFDQEVTANGAAKVGTQFIGWTSTTIVDTFALFTKMLAGADIASAGLVQSVSDAMVVQRALGTALRDALARPTIAGATNPATGRRPDLSAPVWAGGSLGGTMGFVYSSAEPTIQAGVLNVPGAAWTQFVWYSEMFNYVRVFMQENYPTQIDQALALATAQNDFDRVDGAVWFDATGATRHPLLLEQESIGDPVLPNIGNEMVASASHAVQVGVVLNHIPACSHVTVAKGETGMTQFKVPSSVTDPLQIHGFAAGTTPAGIAAQQQIQAFIGSVWKGAPVIAVPPECVSNTPPDSCDFSSD